MGGGDPPDVFHGSPRADLEAFDPAAGKDRWLSSEFGTYGTPNRAQARGYGENLYQVHPGDFPRNPLRVGPEGKAQFGPNGLTKEQADALAARGYDGIVVASKSGGIDEVIYIKPARTLARYDNSAMRWIIKKPKP